MRLVVAGVSGSGKTTVGMALADALDAEFVDADDLHPESNVAKMSAGIPLDDTDRAPWLQLVGETLIASDRIVVACSALKRRYRDTIRSAAPDVRFVLLEVDRDTLMDRLVHRRHFMPASLLDSQLATLEPLATDEPGATVDATGTVEQTVRAVIATIAAIG